MKIVDHFVSLKTFNKPFYNIVLDFLLGENLDHLWFIYSLFLMYVLWFLIVKHANFFKSFSGKVAILLIAYVANISYQFIDTGFYCWNNLLRYGVFFIAGYIWNSCELGNITEKSKKTYVNSLMAAGIIVAVSYFIDYKITFIAGSTFEGDETTKLFGAALEVFKQFGLIYIVVHVIRELYRKTDFYKSTPVKCVIENSFEIYLFHQPLIRLLNLLVIPRIKNHIELPNLFYSIIATTIAILFAILISKAIKKRGQVQNSFYDILYNFLYLKI